MEPTYVIAFVVYSIVLAAFCLWRGKETYKKRPEVFNEIRNTVLERKADLIAGAADAEAKLRDAAEDIRARAEAEILDLKRKVKAKL